MNTKERFMNSCLDKDYFTIKNNSGNGACLFISFLFFLIERKKDFILNPFFFEVFEGDEDRISDDLIDIYANKIQQQIRRWIIEHRYDTVKIPYLNLNVESFLLSNHPVIGSIDEYEYLFEIYAGDNDFIEEETNEIYKRGPNKGKKKITKIKIEPRWGGTTETYAFSQMYSVNVNQWFIKSYNERMKKETICTLRSKNFRYYLAEKIEYKDDNHMTINLLHVNNNHYALLLEKND